MNITVLVKKYSTGEVIKKIPCTSLGKAEKIQRGLDVNINHDEYYSVIETATEKE